MGLRIKEVIKERGTTITDLSEKMGINRVNLSNMVNGNPTYETLEKIAAALGVNIAELFEQPRSNEAGITCPHCGKPITIKAE